MSQSFVAASRRQLRFFSTKGPLTVEDLWTLSLKSLDNLAISVDAKITDRPKSFLMNPDQKADQETEDNKLRLDILKQVITTREEENRAAAARRSTEAQRAFLLDLREKRKTEKMEALTEEEIEAQLAALDAPPTDAPAPQPPALG